MVEQRSERARFFFEAQNLALFRRAGRLKFSVFSGCWNYDQCTGHSIKEKDHLAVKLTNRCTYQSDFITKFKFE